MYICEFVTNLLTEAQHSWNTGAGASEKNPGVFQGLTPPLAIADYFRFDMAAVSASTCYVTVRDARIIVSSAIFTSQ